MNLLEDQIRKLIEENVYVDFGADAMGNWTSGWLHRYFACGKAFGTITALWYRCCRILRQRTGIIKKYFYDYYTDIEISHAASVAHHKSANQIRNREYASNALFRKTSNGTAYFEAVPRFYAITAIG